MALVLCSTLMAWKNVLTSSEAVLQEAKLPCNWLQMVLRCVLIEMRPFRTTGAHHGDKCAELVCSNSLKSTKEASAAGMLKAELELLGSHLLAFAHESSVPAGGALAVDREQFASLVTDALVQAGVARIEAEVVGIDPSGRVHHRRCAP